MGGGGSGFGVYPQAGSANALDILGIGDGGKQPFIPSPYNPIGVTGGVPNALFNGGVPVEPIDPTMPFEHGNQNWKYKGYAVQQMGQKML